MTGLARFPLRLCRGTALRQFEHRFLAMGTEIAVKLICAREERARARAEMARVAALLQAFGHEGWAWGDGALAGFNRALQTGAVVPVPRLLRPLLVRAWAIHRQSGGCFDPRIGNLVRLWGFDDIARLRLSPPADDEVHGLLQALRAAPAYDGGDRYGPAPGIAWDLGGIGKGYIVDQALALLGQRGFRNAVIDAGGHLAARGAHAARPWRVGVRDPRACGAPRLLASLEVCDESVVTHGDDQRCFEYQGRRYAHLLDPHSGRPVHGLRCLTVVHPDGTLADAGGAALFVAGAGTWRALARRLGLTQVLVMHEDGRVQATPQLARRLRAAHGISMETLAD